MFINFSNNAAQAKKSTLDSNIAVLCAEFWNNPECDMNIQDVFEIVQDAIFEYNSTFQLELDAARNTEDEQAKAEVAHKTICISEFVTFFEWLTNLLKP